jgi:hypothetical protein
MMSRYAFVAMAAMAAAAIFCACGDSPGIGDFTDADYFPFTAANAWTYERFGQVDTLGLTYSFSGAAMVSVSGVEEQPYGDLIQLFTAGTDTLFGEGVDSIFIPLGGTSFARMNDQGVWMYTDSLMTDSVQVAQFPLAVGDTWLYSADPEATAEVIAMDEVVSVPDGEFDDVLHIRITQGDLVSIVEDDYYAPGIGNIMNTMSIHADTTVVYEMTQQLTHHMLF